MQVASGHFLGFKHLKMGYEDLVDIFRVIIKLDYIYGSFLCILGSFLKVKVQNGGYFFGLLKFQIIVRVLEIPDIFGGEGLMLDPSLLMKKYMRVPSPSGAVHWILRLFDKFHHIMYWSIYVEYMLLGTHMYHSSLRLFHFFSQNKEQL